MTLTDALGLSCMESFDTALSLYLVFMIYGLKLDADIGPMFAALAQHVKPALHSVFTYR